MPLTRRERFERYFERGAPDDCWLWQGWVKSNGYGGFGRHEYAHRVSHELFVGPIPEGHDVAHSCDTPRCVNPAHLEAKTHAENLADMVERGRSNRGERHWNDRLGDRRRREIRGSPEKATVLAARYGIHPRTVRKIRGRAVEVVA